jgi:hypothetical protein
MRARAISDSGEIGKMNAVKIVKPPLQLTNYRRHSRERTQARAIPACDRVFADEPVVSLQIC